jgi:ribonuclease P protein component
LQTRKSPISEPELGLSGVESRKRFRREEHLKRRTELTRVFKKGRVTNCPGIKLFFLANGLPHNRIVITFVRKYGNAVQRNRARRLGREAYRLMKGTLKTGYDLVFLVYPGLPAVNTLAERTQQLKTLFRKAGLWLEP